MGYLTRARRFLSILLASLHSPGVVDNRAGCHGFKLIQKTDEKDKDAIACLPSRTSGRTPTLTLGKRARIRGGWRKQESRTHLGCSKQKRRQRY